MVGFIVAGCGSSPVTSSVGASPSADTRPSQVTASNAPTAATVAGPQSPTLPSTQPSTFGPFTTSDWLGNLTIGPDATVYAVMSGRAATDKSVVLAFDGSGAVKPGWPYRPDDLVVSQLAVGPGGLIYVVTSGTSPDSSSHLAVLAPGGSLQAPIVTLTGSPSNLTFAPDGTVYYEAKADGVAAVHALDARGQPKSGWPVQLPAIGQLLLGQDGSVYVQSESVSSTVKFPNLVEALGPDGQPKSGWPLQRAPGTSASFFGSMTLGPDQSLYVTVLDPPKGVAVAVFGPDGQPKLSWHRSVVSGFGIGAPILAADGTVYVDVLGALGSDQPDRIVALDPTGTPKKTWTPDVLPPQTSVCAAAVNPLSGVVYASLSKRKSATESTPDRYVALGPDGKPLAAWPSNLPSSCVPPDFGADGTAFIVSGKDVYAFAPDGSAVKGWPYQLPNQYATADIVLAPTGGVYLEGVGPGAATIVEVNADGQVVGK